MKENETLLNSFLANGTLLNVVCCGVKQYTAHMFDAWTAGSLTYEQAIIAKDSRMFFKIAGVSVFDYLFLLMVITTIILIAVNGSGRIRYNDLIDEKGKPKSVRKKVVPKDILSIRFGASYKKQKDKDADESSDEDETELLGNYDSIK